MDSEKILRNLRAVQNRALTAAAYVLLAHILPFVPIAGAEGDPNTLRGSAKIKEFEGGMAISFGGSGDSKKYAAYQYFEAKYHHFANGAMARLVELLTGDERASVTGDIAGDRYAAAYRQAKEQGRLAHFPNGARWFEIVMKDMDVQRRAWAAYSGALRAA